MITPYRQSLVVDAAAIDELGHVSNVVYLRWLLAAAQAHSNDAGFDLARYRELGAVFVVRRHEIDYLQSAIEGDELTVSTLVSAWRGASCTRQSTIHRGEDVLVQAMTTWAFVDPSGRPRRIPDAIRSAFG